MSADPAEPGSLVPAWRSGPQGSGVVGGSFETLHKRRRSWGQREVQENQRARHQHSDDNRAVRAKTIASTPLGAFAGSRLSALTHPIEPGRPGSARAMARPRRGGSRARMRAPSAGGAANSPEPDALLDAAPREEPRGAGVVMAASSGSFSDSGSLTPGSPEASGRRAASSGASRAGQVGLLRLAGRT